MKKLQRLKSWFTLEEAAQHISYKIKQTITLADLYNSAFDGYLKFSVYFINCAYGIKGDLGKVGGLDYQLQQQDFDVKDRTVHCLNGIWDLTMQGKEALEVKGYFEQINSGIEVKKRSKNGILLQQDGVTCQLYKHFDRERIFNPKYNESDERRCAIAKNSMAALENHPSIVSPLIRVDKFGFEYVPCNKLSEGDCVLIIRNSEVNRFIQLLEEHSQEEKPITTNEKNSLLVLVAALCKCADVDWNRRGITTSLVAMTDLIGAPLSDETIRKILKQIDPAIDSRSK